MCQGRKEELREECREALGKALIPTKLSCLPLFRNVFVCQNPVGGISERRCSKEYQEVSECLKVPAFVSAILLLLMVVFSNAASCVRRPADE